MASGARAWFFAALCLLFLRLSPAVSESEDRANRSSLGRIIWPTGRDESELLAAIDSSDDSSSSALEDSNDDEIAGGFSSLEGMLQWAIGHSDPAKLKEKANGIQQLSANELKKRQVEIKELMERLKMPSDAEMMQIAINDLNNSSLSSEGRQSALHELLDLVESIDNANDLDKLGGIVAVVRELYNSEPEIRATSAWILGKTSQNNALLQDKIIKLGALTRLMKMVKSSYIEESVKALYAVSALIRNNDSVQELFYSEEGILLLQDIMTNSSVDTRLKKKAVLLVTDLADHHLDNVDTDKTPFLINRDFLKSVVDLISSSDQDLQEKGLLAIRSLLQLVPTQALDFRDYCNLDRVLEAMRDHLENIMTEAEHRDYATDMESLQREVDTIFHQNLEKMSMVPT